MIFILRSYGLDEDHKEQLVGLMLKTKLRKRGAFFEETSMISYKECLSMILGLTLIAPKHEV